MPKTKYNHVQYLQQLSSFLRKLMNTMERQALGIFEFQHYDDPERVTNIAKIENLENKITILANRAKDLMDIRQILLRLIEICLNEDCCVRGNCTRRLNYDKNRIFSDSHDGLREFLRELAEQQIEVLSYLNSRAELYRAKKQDIVNDEKKEK